MIKKYKGNVLIIVLFVMLLLATISITFIQLNILEFQMTSTNNARLKAKLAAEAGIQYAILSLQETFGKSIDSVGTSNWWSYKTHTTTPNNLDASNCALEYDNAAPEYSLNKQEQLSEDAFYIPSYSMDISKLQNCPCPSVSGFSGTLTQDKPDHYIIDPNNNHPYTLKIVDTTSQFPLNTHATQKQVEGQINAENDKYKDNAIPIVGAMLNTLSKEVAKISGDYPANDDPLHGLGKAIIKKRNKLGGFKRKDELVGTYTEYKSLCPNATSDTITLDDLNHICNYITVYPTWADMKDANIYRQVAPINTTEDKHCIEYRCPVNINTASFPVLMAVLSGIEYKDTTNNTSILIEHSDAFIIAKTIINLRKNIGHFTSWESFTKFLDILKKQYKEKTDTRLNNKDKNNGIYDMLVSNFDPNIHLKGTNPDRALYKKITKPELTTYTTEFCFFPLGTFDITSLGEVYDFNQNRSGSATISSIIHIYDPLYLTSQSDFEGLPNADQDVSDKETIAYKPNKFDSRMYGGYEKAEEKGYGIGYNAFTMGNYTLKNYNSKEILWSNCSQCFGHIMPLAYKTGSTVLDSEVCFPDNNNSRNNDQSQSEKNSRGYSPLDTYGVATDNLGFYFTDGIYLKKGMNSISFPITKENFPEAHFPPIPLNDYEENKSKLPNEGTICFWFKLAKDSSTDEKNDKNSVEEKNSVTVFFSDQYDAKTHLGLQRRITFNILPVVVSSKDDDEEENPQILRKMEIIFENKIYYTGSNISYDLWRKMPYYTNSRYDKDYGGIFNNFLTHTKKKVILDPQNSHGIHAQEWYHLAVRWHNGLQLDKFEDSSNSSAWIAICGNFYNEKDVKQTSDNSDNSIVKLLITDEGKLAVDMSNNQTVHRKEDKNPYGWWDHTEKVKVKDDKGEEKEETREKYPLYSKDHFNACQAEPIAEYLKPLVTLTDTQKNHLYIGSYDSSDDSTTMPKKISLANFRIANEADNTIDDENYFPSRFPKAITIDDIPYAGVFQGKIASKIPGTITSVSWTNRTDGTIKPGYSTYVINNEKGDSAYNEFYNELFNKFWAGISLSSKGDFNTNLSYEQYNNQKYYTNWTPQIVINKIDIPASEGVQSKTIYEKRMYLDVTYNEKTYSLQKSFDANTILEEEKNAKYTEIPNSIKGCKISKYQCYPTSNSPSSYSSMKELLDDWKENYEEKYKKFLDEEKFPNHPAYLNKFQQSIDTTASITPLDKNNKTYVVNEKNKTFVYEIMFPTGRNEDQDSIFNGPSIDDVTFINMLHQPKILEYSSEKLQPNL